MQQALSAQALPPSSFRKAPLLYRILYTLTSRNDHRNTKKVRAAHFRGICFAADGEELCVGCSPS